MSIHIVHANVHIHVHTQTIYMYMYVHYIVFHVGLTEEFTTTPNTHVKSKTGPGRKGGIRERRKRNAPTCYQQSIYCSSFHLCLNRSGTKLTPCECNTLHPKSQGRPIHYFLLVERSQQHLWASSDHGLANLIHECPAFTGVLAMLVHVHVHVH